MTSWLVVVRYEQPGTMVAHQEHLEQEAETPEHAAAIALKAFRALAPDFEVTHVTVYELAGRARRYNTDVAA